MLNEQEKSNLYSLFIGFNRYLTFKQENPLFLPQEALDFFDLFFYSLYLECCDQKKSLFQIDKKDFFLALIEWEKQFTDLRYFSTYIDVIINAIQTIKTLNFQHLKRKLSGIPSLEQYAYLYSHTSGNHAFFLQPENSGILKYTAAGSASLKLVHCMLSDAFILSLMKLSEDVYIEKLSAIESTIENADHDTQQLWHDFRYKILERGYAAYHLTRTAERNAKSNPSHNCLDFTNGYTDITETEATELLTQFFTAEGKLNQDLLHILKLEYNLATNLCL